PMAEREQPEYRTLVTRIMGGDRYRFTELVRRYEKRVINYVYRITHRYEEAHDLAQEIFVKVYLAQIDLHEDFLSQIVRLFVAMGDAINVVDDALFIATDELRESIAIAPHNPRNQRAVLWLLPLGHR